MAKITKYYIGRVAMYYDDETYTPSEGVSNVVEEFDTLSAAQARERELNAEANKRNISLGYHDEPELYTIIQFQKHG